MPTGKHVLNGKNRVILVGSAKLQLFGEVSWEKWLIENLMLKATFDGVNESCFK